MSCTLPYAAPEAVVAYAHTKSLAVKPSLDVWAVGVTVFECLTGQPPFARDASEADVLACAEGATAYPWERPLAQLPDKWRDADARALFEGCLKRTASERPSASELVQGLAAYAASGHG